MTPTEATAAVVNKACAALADSGFVNFFGLQRFGSGGVSTARLGLGMLKKDWAAVVDLILTRRQSDDEATVVAKQMWTVKKDPEAAARLMPRANHSEYAVVATLAKQGSNALWNALESIPRKLRLMYLHAYQSSIWNKAANARAECFGVDRVVVGDLVRDLEAEATEETNNGEKRVHLVTAEDVEAGRYSIYDVVLPLPGFKVEYPQYTHEKLKTLYQDALDSDGVTDAHIRSEDMPELRLSGDYRAFLQQAKDFEWRLEPYSDASEVLVSSDADKLVSQLKTTNKRPPRWDDAQARATSSDQSADPKSETPDGKADDTAEKMEVEKEEKTKDGDDAEPAAKAPEAVHRPHLALCVSFTLPSSAYATVLLRELMKQPMGTAHHTSLGDVL